MSGEHGLVRYRIAQGQCSVDGEAMSRVQVCRTKKNLHPEDTGDRKTAKFRSSLVFLDVAGVL